MLDLVAIFGGKCVMSSDAMLMLFIYSISLILLLWVHLIVTRILEGSVGAEAPKTLQKPDGCSSLQNQVTTVGFISEDFQPDGACWVMRMHPLNRTTFDLFLQEVGQQKLNYTIYTAQADESVSGENYHNGVNPLASDFAGRAILTRASYPQVKPWFVRVQAARLATGIIAHILLTGIGALTSSFGVYRNDWEMTVIGVGAICGAVWLGFRTSPLRAKGTTQIINLASAHKRKNEAWDALKRHLNLSGNVMNSDISVWQLMGTENSHHLYKKRGDGDGHGHQELVLFRKPNLSVKSKRCDGRADVYGIRYTCYEPKKDSFLQQAF